MDQYLGEIRLCAFDFAPKGWALCNGAQLSIAQNQALFSLLGTQYGGNGTTNFALPDLRGRTPLHRDSGGIAQGQMAGVETVTLTTAQVPAHSHPFNVSSSPATALNVGVSQDRVLAASNLYNASDPSVSGPGQPLYGTPDSLAPLLDEACGSSGGGQPHDNMQPSLVLNYIISLAGIYPGRG
ncbi:phage tail protein [Cupriavidus taiwanensis]|uniref:phage tail protein n=1 Tax=Cupriavidus taiwanensis TaxID=164546 RepID=UPI000E202092|nr:tail fiber protein [Cupriavidus taiwanensis]